MRLRDGKATSSATPPESLPVLDRMLLRAHNMSLGVRCSQRGLLQPTEAGGWVEWPMTAVEWTRPAHCYIIVVKEVHSDGAGSGEGLDGAP